jgi:hypothetical protein
MNIESDTVTSFSNPRSDTYTTTDRVPLPPGMKLKKDTPKTMQKRAAIDELHKRLYKLAQEFPTQAEKQHKLMVTSLGQKGDEPPAPSAEYAKEQRERLEEWEQTQMQDEAGPAQEPTPELLQELEFTEKEIEQYNKELEEGETDEVQTPPTPARPPPPTPPTRQPLQVLPRTPKTKKKTPKKRTRKRGSQKTGCAPRGKNNRCIQSDTDDPTKCLKRHNEKGHLRCIINSPRNRHNLGKTATPKKTRVRKTPKKRTRKKRTPKPGCAPRGKNNRCIQSDTDEPDSCLRKQDSRGHVICVKKKATRRNFGKTVTPRKTRKSKKVFKSADTIDTARWVATGDWFEGVTSDGVTYGKGIIRKGDILEDVSVYPYDEDMFTGYVQKTGDEVIAPYRYIERITPTPTPTPSPTPILKGNPNPNRKGKIIEDTPTPAPEPAPLYMLNCPQNIRDNHSTYQEEREACLRYYEDYMDKCPDRLKNDPYLNEREKQELCQREHEDPRRKVKKKPRRTFSTQRGWTVKKKPRRTFSTQRGWSVQ